LFILVCLACRSDSAPPGGPGEVDAPVTPHDADTDDGPISATCKNRMAQPLDANWTITVPTGSRTVRVHVPASYDPTKRTPVVINMHGRTGDGLQQAAQSYMFAKSNLEGFIAVHPESITSPTSWNAGWGCCNPANMIGVDDVGFIRALISELEAKLCVDPDRVFATGFSNGGYLAHRVACELSDRIAAIGSVAGLLQVYSCPVTRPMPVFDVHGTADPLVSYSWVDPTIQYWVKNNACTTMETSYQNGDATCVTHGGCNQGADVVHCAIDGGGHQWPGGLTIGGLGKNSNDLIATDAMWAFFAAHPLTH
jgi:polyhydroxybutyrate depolymerase